MVQRSSGLPPEAHRSCEELVLLALSGHWQVPKVFQSCWEGNSQIAVIAGNAEPCMGYCRNSHDTLIGLHM